MSTCSKCGKIVKNDSMFCPFCGANVVNIESEVGDALGWERLTVEKKIPRKVIISALIVAAFLSLSLYIIICEAKISKARSLYAQGKFWEASEQIENIPMLGREELFRIKAAAEADKGYTRYLITKRVRLSSSGTKSKDAYQEACLELMFCLLIDLREIKKNTDGWSEIELDEFRKIVELCYSELLSMFYMSKAEANELVEKLEQLESNEMQNAVNEWLDDNFF